jgi:hypothetical protein
MGVIWQRIWTAVSAIPDGRDWLGAIALLGAYAMVDVAMISVGLLISEGGVE